MLEETAADAQLPGSVQLGLAVGLVGIALWRLDLATQRIHLNDWGYQLVGMQPQRDGLPIDELRAFLHPEDRPAVERAARMAIEGTGIVDTEARYRRPDGSYRALHTRRIAERDASGRAVALIGVSLDVTEQARERERAHQATQSIEMIAEATGVGVWSTDVDTMESVWNGQMWCIYGISPDIKLPEARHMASLLTDPADRERLDAAFWQLARGGAPIDELEFRIRRPDGEPRWIIGRGRFVQHGDRRVVSGVFMDVTERRSTQEQLRRAEQRTMLAAKTVGLAIWERDLITGEAWWDAQMYHLRGMVPDERPPNELRHSCIHPDDLAYVERRTEQVIAGESDYTFDFRVCWPDGSVHWLATRGSVVRDEQGRAQRVLGVNWDITEHKHGEDMRREKAAAEQASRDKSEFLSRMSHELRTPLNAVLGFTQLILGDGGQALPLKQRERAQRIHDAGRHLLALIDDVLDLTSVDTAPAALEPVPLAPLVQETLQWVAPAAQRAGVTLVNGVHRGAVCAEAKRLRQVLANLLSNAVKYNRPGGRVEISVVDETAGGEWLGVRVRDSGRGMTPAQLQRMFEPFNRLGAEREGIEGTGIGLTIVRALVQHMGGRVEVNSTAGEGTEFRVWLVRAGQPAPLPASTPATLPGAAAAPEGPIDLLYIEDNAINVLLVRELVSLRPAVHLHVASDGRGGIAQARTLRPRAVLIDLQLPDMHGFDVLRTLRADDTLDGLTCIALSANAMPEDIARAKQIGFDEYWTKPIDVAQFLGGLDRLSRGN